MNRNSCCSCVPTHEPYAACSAAADCAACRRQLPQTTSEKALRKELQKHFKTDISEKKQLVKEHVSCRQWRQMFSNMQLHLFRHSLKTRHRLAVVVT